MNPLLLGLIAWIVCSPFLAVAATRWLFRGRRRAREAVEMAEADEFIAALRNNP